MKKRYRDYLIVDGYNVINAWPKLKELSKTDLEASREELNTILSEYASFKGVYTIIVYDAYRIKTSDQRETEIGNLKVVYTKEKQTADAYIEKLIAQFGPKKHLNISVATDDMAEQQMILGKGGSRISTRELLIEVENSRAKIGKKTQNTNVSKNTLDSIIDKETWEKLEKIRKNSQ